MPVYRTVSKSDAATAEAASQFILDDTGGAVQHAKAFPVIEEVDCWRVPVFSADGHAVMPLPRGAVFPKDNRMSDAEIIRQENLFKEGLKERREFSSAGADGQGWTLGIATGPGFNKQ
jgi:hypothetical protein